MGCSIPRMRTNRPLPVWARTLATTLVVGALAWSPLEGQTGPPYAPGFPLEIAGTPVNQVSPVGSQVMAADLGLTPGFKSIVFGLRNGKLYVIRRVNATTWSVAAGWPVQLPAHIYSSPAVGDLDGDGQPDIVVGYGSTFDTGNPGGLKAFHANGTLMWSVITGDVTPGPPNGLSDPVESTPAIGDVDGDGTPEVVFGGLDHQLYVVNGENGLSNNAAIWPKDMQDTVFSSPALYDLDGDGKRDIIIGTDSFLDDGGRLRVLRYDGTELPGFPKILDQVISSSPAVGDIDGDGLPEIVHGTGSFYPLRNARLYAWHHDGTAVSGWPAITDGEVITSPVLVNLDSDPELEVVATASSSRSSDGKFRLYAFDGGGSTLFSTVVKDFFGSSLSAGEPVVADVLDDPAGPPSLANSDVEILVPTNGEVALFDRLGNELTETDNFPDDPPPTLMTQDSLAGVAATDLQTDGSGAKIEVIAVSARCNPACTGGPPPNFDHTITVIHVWNPISRTSAPPWGFFRRDEKRRGVARDLLVDGFESGGFGAWSARAP